MKHPRRLQQRIVLYFCACISILLIAYSGAMIAAVMWSQDIAFNRQLAIETERIAEHVARHTRLPSPLPPGLSAFRRHEEIPPPLRPHVRQGPHRAYEINAGDLNYHASSTTTGADGDTIYVLHDVSAVELSEQAEQRFGFLLLGIGLAVLLAGLLLARAVARQILRPVSLLADSVKTLSLEDGLPRLPAYDSRDEIGTLVSTIEELVQRVAAFTRREREFTAHASHELRTPVTVIKGAVEVLRTRRGENPAPGQSDPLARIERALADIEALIAAFLLLARHQPPPAHEPDCDLARVAAEVVDAHRHLLAGKHVEVRIEAAGTPSVHAPLIVVSIALANLVRNAFQHTADGSVTIHATPECVRVADTGPGLGHHGARAGIGLTIVRRLCEQMGWRLDVANGLTGGTEAVLAFETPESTAARSSG